MGIGNGTTRLSISYHHEGVINSVGDVRPTRRITTIFSILVRTQVGMKLNGPILSFLLNASRFAVLVAPVPRQNFEFPIMCNIYIYSALHGLLKYWFLNLEYWKVICTLHPLVYVYLKALCNMCKSICWGPLILLPHFHYSMIRHCSMHNINLGFAQVACGSALFPGFQN